MIAPTVDNDPGSRGIRLVARDLSRSVTGVGLILDGVSLSIAPGELVAIVGGSGAGKSTLLEALAGVSRADRGQVTFDGTSLYDNADAFRSILGYVPQDDILHTELPLERTLRYAARLRLPAATSRSAIDTAVTDAMAALGLSDRAGTRVAALSGGQRKRASIAVEMLTRPRVFFLDEPTSGLDPVTSAELLRLLRTLAATEATVVFTTHALQDLARVDRVVFLARGGRVAFVGRLDEARRHFGVSSDEQIYERLADWAGSPVTPAEPAPTPPEPATPVATPARQRPGAFRQWRVLTARAFETMARNRLTLAILLGSPAMIVAMFVVLFQRGAFDVADPDPTSILMIVFWMAFGAFFFGVTYGLLQICTERPILRREHLVGLRLGPYLFSKLTVLLPFLLTINVLMIVVLRALDRLPAASTGTYLSITITLTLGATAALALGIVTSAAVGNPAQATLALPMLCFPAVLFSGAILPVHVMSRTGAWLSTIIPVRWSFEAVGRDLKVRELLLAGGSPLGPPLVDSYGTAGQRTVGTYWMYLAVSTVVLLVATWIVLARTADRNSR